MQPAHFFIYLVLLVTVTACLWRISTPPVAILVGVCGLLIFIIKLLPLNVDAWLHTPLIRLPHSWKCATDINCKVRGCNAPQALDDFDTQRNADIDIYTVCHVLLWFGVAILDPRIQLWHVIAFSLAWELVEAGAGCVGFRMHARVTDILANLLGYVLALRLFAR